MNTRSLNNTSTLRRMAILLAVWPVVGLAQIPVDSAGNPIGEYQPELATADAADVPLASATELGELVGAIALYPDDLLAIVLPASTFPLQLVEAARFLEDLKSDSTLQPDDDWDDSVVALTNYPEVVELLNDDLDWTWRLGEAVVAQQADVIAAIEAFRDRAYAAGNLSSDEHQNVTNDDGIIEITPVNEEIIYVPYYEPESVVVYQPRPVYYYYPRAYPVYYYPYSYGHSFDHGFFWGITTAYTIGWSSNYLNVHHHSYYGHPYYGYSYNSRWWYRRPSINVYNSYYVNNRHGRSRNQYYSGDRWQPHQRRRLGPSGRQVTRTRYLPNRDTQIAQDLTSNARRNGRTGNTRNRDTQRLQNRDSVRQGRSGRQQSDAGTRLDAQRQLPAERFTPSNKRRDIEFRGRNGDREGRGDRPRANTDRNTQRQQPAERFAPSNKRRDIEFRGRNVDREGQGDRPRANTDRKTQRQQPAQRFSPSNKRQGVESRDRNATVTTNRDRQTRTRAESTRNAPAPTIHTNQRGHERVSVDRAPRQKQRGSRQTTARRVSSQRAAPVARSSSTISRPGNSHAQSFSRAQKSSAPRQQRQSAPKPQKSRSSDRSGERKEARSGSNRNNRRMGKT